VEAEYFSSPGPLFPYQTPEVLLSYVSKDRAEGEEDLSISCLTGDTGHPRSGVSKMVTKAWSACNFSDMAIPRRHLPMLSEFIGKRSGSLYRNDDFSEMGGILHGGEGFAGLPERENAVDHRPEASLRDGPVHFHEMLPRADVDATYL
jgi:hypothetical protein